MSTPANSFDPALESIVADHQESILITIRRDGRPQSSNVIHLWEPETSSALISVTATRAKSRNVERDPGSACTCWATASSPHMRWRRAWAN